MDTMYAKIKQANAKIITLDDKPATNKLGRDLVDDLFFEDQEGFYIGLSHHTPPPTTTALASSMVIGESLEFVARNLDETQRVYKDILGYAMPPSSQFRLFRALNDGLNTPGASTRTANGPLPGRSHPNFGTLRYLEFKDIERTPVQTRIQDPGSTVMRLSVRDLALVIKDLKAAGLTVITKGGGPVKANASQYLMFRDPDNIYVDLVQHDSKSE
jgi:hypothetical protein